MKILQVHNYYQYSGGEDVVFKDEHYLLTSYGHEVFQYIKSNNEIDNYSFLDKIRLFKNAPFSKKSYQEILKIIKKFHPDICHVHNTLPLISPSIYYACNKYNIPVIQTLHNYRLICSNAYLFRNGNICEECIGKSLYHSVKYGCYRNSKIQTLTLARMVEKHKKMGTWNNIVDGYICLTNFAKDKFIEGGLPKEKLFIKPNFLSDINVTKGKDLGYFFFMGRFDVTKGIKVLLISFEKIQNIKLKVAGSGPLKKDFDKKKKNIEYLGQQQRYKILELLSASIALVFPSVWYEGMPMSIVEAFACSKPVIASDLGAMTEMIEDGKTGLLFETGNAEDLTSKIKWANEHLEEMKQMGINARKVYEEKYTSEINYKILVNIYNTVIERSDLSHRLSLRATERNEAIS